MVVVVSAPWVRVDLQLVAAHGVEAALVHGLIGYRCQVHDGWEATHEQIAAEAGITPYAVRRALAVLRDAALVTASRADRFRPTLTWHVPAGQPVTSESDVTRRRDTPSPVSAESEVSSTTQKVEEVPLPPGEETSLFGAPATPAPRDPMAGFDDWWALYPRKTAKAAARKVWPRVTKDTSPEVVTAGLRRQLSDLTDAHTRGFCPHPTTWLNQERWADESNVHQLRPSTAPPDDDYLASLPPLRTDPFAGGRL